MSYTEYFEFESGTCYPVCIQERRLWDFVVAMLRKKMRDIILIQLRRKDRNAKGEVRACSKQDCKKEQVAYAYEGPVVWAKQVARENTCGGRLVGVWRVASTTGFGFF
jgi:hypothetical protein